MSDNVIQKEVCKIQAYLAGHHEDQQWFRFCLEIQEHLRIPTNPKELKKSQKIDISYESYRIPLNSIKYRKFKPEVIIQNRIKPQGIPTNPKEFQIIPETLTDEQ